MLQKVLKAKPHHFLQKENRGLYALILSSILCILGLSVGCMLLWMRSAQKNSILENTVSCCALMEERLFESDLELESVSQKDFLSSEMDFSLPSSTATFAVLQEGRVVSVTGLNILSRQLVASIVKAAQDSSDIYLYKEQNLPGFYFYVVESQVSDLEYCYYEPALTGWQLLRNGIPAGWLLYFTALFFAAIPALFLFLASGPARQTSAQNPELTVPEETDEEVKEETSFGSLPYFSGIIIDYHNTDGKPASPEILRLFDQIIRENLFVNRILYQVSVQCHSDCLQYHMNYSNYNLRVLSDSLKMNLYNAAPDYHINIFYSTAVPTCQEMENELLYLHRHLRYSLILGYGIRLSIEQIRRFEASTAVLDPSAASTIQNHLRTRAYDDLYDYLRHYKDILLHYKRSNACYSFAQVYRFAEEAFSSVKLFFQEHGFEHPILQTTCITILRSSPGFGSFCDYLIECIQAYQHENPHVLSSRNEEIMNTIYRYIEQDLAGANLNSIARKMQMTDSHLSRVFKKNTGSNFSEYLSERKLEEAARLLIQNHKMKVGDISDLLGYGNPTYFLSRFKAKYGISPSAYRKEYLEKNTEKNRTAI